MSKRIDQRWRLGDRRQDEVARSIERSWALIARARKLLEQSRRGREEERGPDPAED